MAVCNIGINKMKHSGGTKATNTWYCASQKMSSRFEEDGSYTVTIKYIMNTDREFTESTNFSILSPYISPMSYAPHAQGDITTIDGVEVILVNIACNPTSSVQYELTETWKSIKSGTDSIKSLKNWTISSSFVRSKYSISDYNGAPAVNTAGDPIDVPVMIQVLDITGRYTLPHGSAGVTSGMGVNSKNLNLLGIEIPKHCALVTKTRSLLENGTTEVIYKCSVSFDTRQLGENDVIIGTQNKNVGGWDILVPNIGWNKKSRTTDEKLRAAVLDVFTGVGRETPDKVMLDENGYESVNGVNYYLMFCPYPEYDLKPNE